MKSRGEVCNLGITFVFLLKFLSLLRETNYLVTVVTFYSVQVCCILLIQLILVELDMVWSATATNNYEAIFVVYRKWVNLVIVSSWHLAVVLTVSAINLFVLFIAYYRAGARVSHRRPVSWKHQQTLVCVSAIVSGSALNPTLRYC